MSLEAKADTVAPSARAETLSADVFSHISRLGLLGSVSQNDFLSLAWDHKVCLCALRSSGKSGRRVWKQISAVQLSNSLCTQSTDNKRGFCTQETLFVSLLDRLGRPTLGQYARERRSFQNRPAEARLDRKRWSEETFRSIFLKIVLKDLKDVGFARVLSVDDLLTKRRR